MSQCTRLLQELKRRPLTKTQILSQLGILNGGGRLHELRQAGYKIRTDMIEVKTRYGASKVARYTLMGSKK